MNIESNTLGLESIKRYLTRYSIRAVSISTGIPYNTLLAVQRGGKDQKGLTKPYHDALSRYILEEYSIFTDIVGINNDKTL